MSSFLDENQTKILMELFDHWMSANEEIMGTILNRKLEITPPKMSDKPAGNESLLISESDFLAFPLTLSSGILGNCYLVFPRKDLAVITDLIIGGDGTSPMMEFYELHISVLEEAINQIAGQLGSILSENLMRSIGIHLGKSEPALKKLLVNWNMICLDYNINLESVSSLKMELLVPVEFCEELVHHIVELKRLAPNPINPGSIPGNRGRDTILSAARLVSFSFSFIIPYVSFI